jgi:hypothetical protein
MRLPDSTIGWIKAAILAVALLAMCVLLVSGLLLAALKAMLI